ncbi:MAG: hypothetical protein ACREM2_11560, partial [Vulcanimicrobiaceae bacterium]
MSAFAPALAVADAVLYEGYILYPYTASARKNRSRFQFGVAMPPNACGAGDRASLGCEFVAEVADATAELTLRARFLQLVHRTVEANDGSAVERLAV